jgi:hypothetical protein
MPLRVSGKGVGHFEPRNRRVLSVDPFLLCEVVNADIIQYLAKEVFPANYEQLVRRDAGQMRVSCSWDGSQARHCGNARRPQPASRRQIVQLHVVEDLQLF